MISGTGSQDQTGQRRGTRRKAMRGIAMLFVALVEELLEWIEHRRTRGGWP
jgi:hypothetical protein